MQKPVKGRSFLNMGNVQKDLGGHPGFGPANPPRYPVRGPKMKKPKL